jgi:hypothetical protein
VAVLPRNGREVLRQRLRWAHARLSRQIFAVTPYFTFVHINSQCTKVLSPGARRRVSVELPQDGGSQKRRSARGAVRAIAVLLYRIFVWRRRQGNCVAQLIGKGVMR